MYIDVVFKPSRFTAKQLADTNSRAHYWTSKFAIRKTKCGRKSYIVEYTDFKCIDVDTFRHGSNAARVYEAWFQKNARSNSATSIIFEKRHPQ